jgi:hypothetical protein
VNCGKDFKYAKKETQSKSRATLMPVGYGLYVALLAENVIVLEWFLPGRERTWILMTVSVTVMLIEGRLLAKLKFTKHAINSGSHSSHICQVFTFH